jgi:hypothetical protein
MCGNGLIGLAQAHRSTSTSATSGGSAARAETLVAHFGREIKAEVAVQDLHSRSIHTTEVVPQVTGAHHVPRTPSGEAA